LQITKKKKMFMTISCNVNLSTYFY